MPAPREDAKTEALTMDARRRQVARLHAAGYSAVDMVRTLTEAGYRRVSAPTIKRDLAALKAKWAEENADAGDLWAQHVQRLAEEIEFWRRQVLLAGDIMDALKIFGDAVIPLLKEMAKLHGLHQPTKIDIGSFIRNWAIENGYPPERAVELAQEVVDSTGF